VSDLGNILERQMQLTVNLKQVTRERDELRALAIRGWEIADSFRPSMEEHRERAKRAEAEVERLGAALEQAQAEVERLKKAAEETEHSMHLRVRAGYDKAIADSWREKVLDVERERDEARAEVERMRNELRTVAERQREACASWFVSNLKNAAADAYAAYQREAHRRGDVRHADNYDDLPDATKELDRVLCRWRSHAVRATPLVTDAEG